ncbi:MAG: alpha/beta fold hydrolase [Hyphomicrobiales bacterium]
MKLSLPQGEIEYIHHRTGVPENAPTIILLHEGLGSVSMWKEFPEQLCEHTGCAVLVYSRFGYGASSKVSLPRPLNYMHIEGQEILPQLIEALVPGNYFLFGHSDGASIAAIYSGEFKHGRHKGTILLAPHFFTEEVGLKSIAIARQVYENGNLRERLERYHANVDNAFYGWNGAWLDPDFTLWNIESFLPKIDVPILAIQGKEDEYGTRAQIDTITRNCKVRVSVSMLAECGHSPHRDQCEKTLNAVSSFISRAE